MTKVTKQQTSDNLKTIKDFDGKKSPYIRYLNSEGLDRKSIVKRFMDVDGIKILYQHVRNVLITPLVGKK